MATKKKALKKATKYPEKLYIENQGDSRYPYYVAHKAATDTLSDIMEDEVQLAVYQLVGYATARREVKITVEE